MASWSEEELKAFKKAQTLQNRPYNDHESFAEDSPVWEVTVDKQVFIRGAKDIENTKWYQGSNKNTNYFNANLIFPWWRFLLPCRRAYN